MRDHDRPAEVPSVVVVAVERAWKSFIRAAPGVVEVGVGVEAVVTAEVTRSTMKFIGSRACRERDEATAGPAILGLVIRGEYFYFFERIGIDRHQRPGVVAK